MSQSAGQPAALPMVVLRSNDICFLGILRSCAAAGVPSIPVVFSWPGAPAWWSEHSRHFKDPKTIPNPFDAPDAAADAFCALGERLLAQYGQRLMVLPSSDVNLMFMVRYWARFSAYFRIMGDRSFDAPREDILAKDRCMALLADAGVRVPLSASCRHADDVEVVAEQMRYPCVYKPAEKDLGQSFYRAHGGDKAIEVADSAVLIRQLRDELAAGFELVVQEKVDFDVLEDEIPIYVYVDAAGRIRMAATAVKETIQPFPFGTATVLRLAWHAELLAPAQAVVDALAYRGILMIEFIRDRRDGQWKVIELNPRPWLFFDFFRRGGGLNYVALLQADMAGTLDETLPLQLPSLDDANNAPRHIDLARAYRAEADQPLAQWLAKIQGARSLTGLDPDDPAPGVQELRCWADDNGHNADAVVGTVRQAVVQ